MNPLSPGRRILGLVLSAVVAGATLTACSGSEPSGGPGDGVRVVTSTSVYGSIAEAVVGDLASVESVISDPTADPHSFEASPADAARVAEADLVVYNGAGYDAFVDRALADAEGTRVVRAVDEFAHATATTVQTHDHADESSEDHAAHAESEERTTTNEHVWFSLPTVAEVADRIAEELSALDAPNAEAYRENARRFGEGLGPLRDRVGEIADRGPFDVVQTEPIGAHLFEEAGLRDRTPHGFLTAIEDDTDPSAADLTATLELLEGHGVDVLAFNVQTGTPVTGRVRDAAVRAGVPVVELTETLPEGTDYTGWMTAIVDDLDAALPAARPAPARAAG